MDLSFHFLTLDVSTKAGQLQWGNLYGLRDEQTVVVIDGGTKQSGYNIVRHLKTYYQTDTVDFVISTHCDVDHVSGLTVVLRECTVRNLLMHRPWEHAEQIRGMFKDGRITVKGLEARMEKALQAARDLEALAIHRFIPISEPFTGIRTQDGTLQVLGPSRMYYEILLADFRCTPDAHDSPPSVVKPILGGLKRVTQWVKETLDILTETLDDTGTTSAENNSSTILLLTVGDQQLLFTGDAGIPALTQAVDYAEGVGFNLSRLNFLQVPHHGSKRNIGPTILNRIRSSTAFISAAKHATPKHPSKKVTNALIRRGCDVYATQGNIISHRQDAPMRASWVAASRIPFFDEVEL